MTVNRNRAHTVIAVDQADIVAAIAGMISTLGTRHGHNCLKFDSDGPNRFTSVWRMTDRASGFGVSFRQGSDDQTARTTAPRGTRPRPSTRASTHQLPLPRTEF